MKKLGREELIDGLRELVRRAHASGVTGAKIYIVGGAALRLAYYDRPTTPDIDAKIEAFGQLKPLVEEIAAERGWYPDWLNDQAAKFLPVVGDFDIDWQPIHDDEHISVWIAPVDALLAMKLKAMEGRSGRDERDVAHLLALNGCTNAEEAETILDRFFPGDALNDRAYSVLLAIFETGLPMVPETPAHIDLR